VSNVGRGDAVTRARGRMSTPRRRRAAGRLVKDVGCRDPAVTRARATRGARAVVVMVVVMVVAVVAARGRGARAQRMEASVAAPQVRLESFAREREREGDARGRLEGEKMRDEVD